MNNSFIQVFVSCESKSQAKILVDALLNDQIIACAQILPNIESYYRWQGKTAQAEECLLLLKSRQSHFSAIEAIINALIWCTGNYCCPYSGWIKRVFGLDQ